jgi:hypothetical protein
MNTNVSDLNVITALKNALIFCVDFIQRHWVISIIYFLSCVASHMVTLHASQEVLGVVKNLDLTEIFSKTCQALLAPASVAAMFIASIVGFFMAYYATKAAYQLLNASFTPTNKSMLQTLWQLFCLHLIIGVIAIPLYCILILPGVWWSTRVSVASVNLLCSDDGPIDSLKKSFAYTNNHFWACFGYWCGTSTLVVIAISIIGGILGMAMAIASISGTIASAGQFTSFDWRILCVKSLVQSLTFFIQIAIIYFCQTWLYTYLKKQAELAPS